MISNTSYIDPRYQCHLAGYEPDSAEQFVKHNAAYKIHCLREGPGMVKFRLHQAIEYQEDACERLFDIQQKKMFDLQVRWRGGEITLLGVVIQQQFMDWEQYPHACPWLPPITQEEYKLHRALLLAALPAAFEEDEFRRATGLTPAAPDQYRAYHDADKPDDDMEEDCAPSPIWTARILRGRVLAGEPANFDY